MIKISIFMTLQNWDIAASFDDNLEGGVPYFYRIVKAVKRTTTKVTHVFKNLCSLQIRINEVL